MTTIITNFKFSKRLKALSLMICHDKKGHPVLYYGTDNAHKILVKKFCGQFDLDKYLVESVMLHLSASKKNIADVRDVYCRLYDALNAIEVVSDEKI